MFLAKFPARLPRAALGLSLSLTQIFFANTARGADDSISTDRPDFVESSQAVGKDRVQVELGFSVERNKDHGIKNRGYSTPFLLRVGLSERLEARLETDGLISTREQGAGATATQNGYADLALGLKLQLSEADGARPGTALLAHVDVDSGSADFRGEGLRPSLRGVAEWELPADTSLGIMPGIVFDKNEEHRFVSGILAVTYGKQWTEHFRSFIEVAGQQLAYAEDGGCVVTYDTGATYLLSNTVQVDASLSRAANDNTPDWAYGVGLSMKF